MMMSLLWVVFVVVLKVVVVGKVFFKAVVFLVVDAVAAAVSNGAWYRLRTV
jgi:uncharacterized membrane protein